MSSSIAEPAPALPAEPVPYHDRLEVRAPDEDAVAEEIVQTLEKIAAITHQDTGRGLRSVHAKAHGLLRGSVDVLPLSLPHAEGLFAQPRRYPALIRLSTSPGDLLDDRVSTPRGFALKVLDVEGTRLPGSEADRTQDFLLVNGPSFLAANAAEFLSSLKLLAATTDRAPLVKRAISAVARGTEKVVEALGSESAVLKGLGGEPEHHLLGETYYSQLPFLYGLYMARWSVAPLSPALQALSGAPVDLAGRPDGLREEVSAYFRQHGARWALRVQLCTDLEAMPIEDPRTPWPEALSPWVTVAHIDVPAQAAWDDTTSTQAEDSLAFSPWHGLAVHRPLGSINRVRRAAYARMAATRAQQSGCPLHEPRGPQAATRQADIPGSGEPTQPTVPGEPQAAPAPGSRG